MTMTASEVAMAFLCSIPSAAVNAGTMIMPPPTPQSAPRRPAAAPTVSAMRIVFMGKRLKVKGKRLKGLGLLRIEPVARVMRPCAALLLYAGLMETDNG